MTASSPCPRSTTNLRMWVNMAERGNQQFRIGDGRRFGTTSEPAERHVCAAFGSNLLYQNPQGQPQPAMHKPASKVPHDRSQRQTVTASPPRTAAVEHCPARSSPWRSICSGLAFPFSERRPCCSTTIPRSPGRTESPTGSCTT
ncbi:uncharacterized protein LOC119766052 [Culex quinquefasciatus]|uniref:uncharacterized protein LOC119766052 n=1 Tax=Culex quinquefasciatus TaxID=7176 RepID=UPI0018E37AD1|nr:uncharacterized protein LOC119766052 [Culex quinquefasciatus]